MRNCGKQPRLAGFEAHGSPGHILPRTQVDMGMELAVEFEMDGSSSRKRHLQRIENAAQHKFDVDKFTSALILT